MSSLILVRHGQSRWNLSNKFTGWVDVPLSEIGVQEAQMAAEKLSNLNIDIAFTSTLNRAQSTLVLILSSQERTGIFIHEGQKNKKWQINASKLDKKEIPIYFTEQLNERHYGDLQGLDKEKSRMKFGEKKIFNWRRSYIGKPPHGESLKDTNDRVLPYFQKRILTEVKKKKNVIVVAHGNSLRVIIKYLEKIPDDNIPLLDIPTADPIIYKYQKGKLLRHGFDFSFDRPTYWQTPE